MTDFNPEPIVTWCEKCGQDDSHVDCPADDLDDPFEPIGENWP